MASQILVKKQLQEAFQAVEKNVAVLTSQIDEIRNHFKEIENAMTDSELATFCENFCNLVRTRSAVIASQGVQELRIDHPEWFGIEFVKTEE